MIWKNQPNRSVELIEKQDLMTQVLEDMLDGIPEPPREFPREIQSILAFIHEHLFSSNLNVAAVRRNCSLGNNNISTRFRWIVGIGLREYIERGRMRAAKRLLTYPDLEIYLIAMAIGYEHPETFCRAFRRQAGCTPSEWREAADEQRELAEKEETR